jgi:hypothetical protein
MRCGTEDDESLANKGFGHRNRLSKKSQRTGDLLQAGAMKYAFLSSCILNLQERRRAKKIPFREEWGRTAILNPLSAKS